MSLLQTASNLGSLWPVLASAAVKSTALLMAAALLSLALRKGSAAARHWLWLLALCGAITLPVLSVTLPQWKVLPPQPVRVAPVVFNTSPAISIPSLFSSAPNQPLSDFASASLAKSPIELPQTTPSRIDWATCAVVAWAGGAAAMLTPIVLGMAALLRLGLQSRIIDDPDWLNLLEELCDLLAIASPVRLLQSERRSMPMIWGISRATILLPAEATKWSDQRKRLVLLHELAHVKRRDGLTQFIAQFARAVYWFNPFAWLAFRRLEIERERACDDIVLTAGNKPSDYASELMAVATGYRTAAIASLIAAPMARASKLEGRLRAILDIRQNRRHSTRRAICVGLIALLMLLLPLAALHSRAASPGDQTAAATQPVPGDSQQVAQSDRDSAIADLIRASQNDIDAGDFNSALEVLHQIIVLDPSNSYATGVRQYVIDRAIVDQQQKAREAFNQAFPNNSAARATPPAATQPAQALLDKVLPEANFANVPFNQVIDYLRDATGANIFVDNRTLEAAGFDRSAPITLKLHNVKLSKALSVILDMVGGQTKLAYQDDQGVITISTADYFDRNVDTQVFDVRDLIEPLPNSDKTPSDLIKDVAKLITDVVAPSSWIINGGAGSISTLEESGQIVVTQTPENQEHILGLLDKIREGQVHGVVKALSANTGPEVAVVHPGAADPWKGSLPNGVTVELIGLSENPSAGRPWWKPDGSLLAERPYDQRLTTSLTPTAHQVTREVALRLSNVPEGSVNTYWNIATPRSTAAGGTEFPSKDGANVRILGECIGVPDDQTRSTMRIGIAAGPWKTLSEDNNVTDIGTYSQAIPDSQGRLEGVIDFSPAVQKDNEVIMTIAAQLPPMDVRAVLIDRNGVEHAPNSAGASGASTLTMMTIQFDNMKIAQIASVRFQARQYQWIEFKDVPLSPKSGGAMGMQSK